MLRQAQGLRSLKLRDCVPLLSIAVAAAGRVPLSCLENLHLMDNGRRCQGLLSQLSVPATTCYRVLCTDTPESFPGPSQHLDDMLPYFERSDTSDITGLYISESLSTEISLFRPLCTE